jgi:hypothetical protein
MKVMCVLVVSALKLWEQPKGAHTFVLGAPLSKRSFLDQDNLLLSAQLRNEVPHSGAGTLKCEDGSPRGLRCLGLRGQPFSP